MFETLKVYFESPAHPWWWIWRWKFSSTIKYIPINSPSPLLPNAHPMNSQYISHLNSIRSPFFHFSFEMLDPFSNGPEVLSHMNPRKWGVHGSMRQIGPWTGGDILYQREKAYWKLWFVCRWYLESPFLLRLLFIDRHSQTNFWTYITRTTKNRAKQIVWSTAHRFLFQYALSEFRGSWYRWCEALHF